MTYPPCPTCGRETRFHSRRSDQLQFRCPDCYGGDEGPNTARVFTDLELKPQPAVDKVFQVAKRYD